VFSIQAFCIPATVLAAEKLGLAAGNIHGKRPNRFVSSLIMSFPFPDLCDVGVVARDKGLLQARKVQSRSPRNYDGRRNLVQDRGARSH
jgi:hypothetical protein